MPGFWHVNLEEATIAQMRMMHSAHVPIADIARLFDCHRQTVQHHCGRRSLKYTKMTSQRERVYIYLYTRRRWTKARFEAAKVDWDSVRRILTLNEIQLRTRGRPRK